MTVKDRNQSTKCTLESTRIGDEPNSLDFDMKHLGLDGRSLAWDVHAAVTFPAATGDRVGPRGGLKAGRDRSSGSLRLQYLPDCPKYDVREPPRQEVVL